jgi:hypothetical protein
MLLLPPTSTYKFFNPFLILWLGHKELKVFLVLKSLHKIGILSISYEKHWPETERE